ncbi:MAG: hypothetical protein PUI48_01720 [Oscillospiraceae bacterium]|nr:hypothetical protein [Oscillospiraceae bacterium]MDY6208242.1 hypothetical protein [Oscillospiraceae bacterium]
MNKKANLSLLLVMWALMLTACGNTGSDNSAENALSEAVSEETTESTNAVAEGAQTVPDGLVIPQDMTPVYADSLKDGEYNIKVDSSSSMFTVTDCVLTVNEGKMTARMTMGGTGYLYLFMGKGENAAEDGYIPFEENSDGTHSFTVPVEGLDMGIDCAAFSRKKEMWYDRTLLFRSDSLPAEAFAEGIINTAESLGLADGEYSVGVSLEGGSGRAKINSPAKLTVSNGEAFAEIVWGSSNYDCMTVGGEKFYPQNTEGNSEFVIPVTGFDYKMPVSANTTAMSTPHEIEYTLYFDSATITAE